MIRGGYPGSQSLLLGTEGSLGAKGGGFEGWILVERIEVFLPPRSEGEGKEEDEEDEDMEAGCSRQVGLPPCRACHIVAVEAGIALSRCLGGGGDMEGGGGDSLVLDSLLLDDERRSRLFAS